MLRDASSVLRMLTSKFLAPSGAQAVTISVRSSDPSLSRAIKLRLSGSDHSQVVLRFSSGVSELTLSYRRSLNSFVLVNSLNADHNRKDTFLLIALICLYFETCLLCHVLAPLLAPCPCHKLS